MANREYCTELVEWLRSQYGPGRKFSTPRQLSIAAGRNQNAVASIEEKGHATADVLVDIARVVGESSLVPFQLMGWLKEEAIANGLSANENYFISLYRSLSPHQREVLIEVAGAMIEPASRTRESPPAGPEPGHQQANSESE